MFMWVGWIHVHLVPHRVKWRWEVLRKNTQECVEDYQFPKSNEMRRTVFPWSQRKAAENYPRDLLAGLRLHPGYYRY